MLNRNNLIVTSLLMLILTIGYLAYNESLNPASQQRTIIMQNGSDHFMTDAQIFNYGANGKLQYTINSQNITHHPDTDSTLLKTPTLVNFGNSGKITRSTSQNGKLLPGGNDIELWGNVVVTQTNDETKNEIRMDTYFIAIFTDQDILETDNPVLITDKFSKIHAIGMTVLYDQGIIKLKSQVRGVHDPIQP